VDPAGSTWIRLSLFRSGYPPRRSGVGARKGDMLWRRKGRVVACRREERKG
jgi:hypothetical protein